MFFHRWSAHALPLREALPGHALAWVILLAMLGATAPARAEPRTAAHGTHEVDTEHLFGFTEGGDTGEAGETELETDSTGRFGRSAGSFNAVATGFEAKYSPTDRFRISAAATVTYYDITGVDGFDDRRGTALQSLSFDARFRLLDRERAPLGLTLSIAPHWGPTDALSGAPADQYGGQFLLIADRELLPGRLFGAVNVSYEPEHTRLRASGESFRESTFGVSTALTAQVLPGVFIGAEARNLRHYDGLGLDRFAGQALYLGPTFYMTLTDKFWLSAAWNVQAWGTTAEGNGALDLTNFERHQVRLRLGVIF